jgi:multidrug efflux pump subunit AcrA (membrane-fusion protein)
MLLKISLGLAILLGVATIFLTHTQLGGKIETLKSDLQNTQTQLTQTQASESKYRAESKTFKTQVGDLERVLGETTNALAMAQSKAAEQQTRADRAALELNTVTAERNTAQAELSQWRLFGMTPDQIRNNLARLRQVEREKDVYITENKALLRELTRATNELERYIGGFEKEVPLPPGTKGSVVAVDPKYDFIVIDICEQQGVLPRAKLLINRDGKLIGKVQLTSVDKNRSVANILPEWKQDEVMEGDQVLF